MEQLAILEVAENPSPEFGWGEHVTDDEYHQPSVVRRGNRAYP